MAVLNICQVKLALLGTISVKPDLQLITQLLHVLCVRCIAILFDSNLVLLVYFPVESGVYAPLVFVSGFYGFLYSEMYSDVLTQLAAHGYIVMGLDLWYPAVENRLQSNSAVSNEAETIDKAITWVIFGPGNSVF